MSVPEPEALPAAPEVRAARHDDAEAIAAIHNQGIGERVATLRTAPRGAAEVRAALDGGRPTLVAERGGSVVGWATVGAYDDPAPHYAGVGEATVYVDRDARRGGVGAALLRGIEEAAATAGYFKLIAKVFASNGPSLRLFAAAGWRTVGTHERHGRLDGEWKDVVVLEKSLEPGS